VVVDASDRAFLVQLVLALVLLARRGPLRVDEVDARTRREHFVLPLAALVASENLLRQEVLGPAGPARFAPRPEPGTLPQTARRRRAARPLTGAARQPATTATRTRFRVVILGNPPGVGSDHSFGQLINTSKGDQDANDGRARSGALRSHSWSAGAWRRTALAE